VLAQAPVQRLVDDDRDQPDERHGDEERDDELPAEGERPQRQPLRQVGHHHKRAVGPEVTSAPWEKLGNFTTP
jgi:hypothetical protein